jgi:hypothetical protein
MPQQEDSSNYEKDRQRNRNPYPTTVFPAGRRFERQFFRIAWTRWI